MICEESWGTHPWVFFTKLVEICVTLRWDAAAQCARMRTIGDRVPHIGKFNKISGI